MAALKPVYDTLITRLSMRSTAVLECEPSKCQSDVDVAVCKTHRPMKVQDGHIRKMAAARTTYSKVRHDDASSIYVTLVCALEFMRNSEAAARFVEAGPLRNVEESRGLDCDRSWLRLIATQYSPLTVSAWLED